MRNVTKDNLTDVFMGYFGDDVDPRMREVMGSLVKHLHNFAKEVNLTHAEWTTGIRFLERAGEISDAERHEFVLLSDVLGLSSLVDMINSRPEGTSSSVLGPFHITGAPDIPFGADLKRHYGGTVLLARGVVTDTEGKPIEGAKIDIWQTAPNGLYSSQDEEQDTYSFHGIMTTGGDGAYGFTTVKPVSYTVPTDGPVGDILRAAGRNPGAGDRGFPDDDPYLDQDTVFGVREDLVMEYLPQPAGTFPTEGYELSGKVGDPWILVEFDLTLTRA